MHLTIPRHELREAVTGLSRVIPKRASLPILQKVRFSRESGRIVATGTDLDQNLSYRFATANGLGEGAILVPLVELQLLTKGAEGDAIEFKAVSDTDIEITHTVGGQSVSRSITTEAPKEWPNGWGTVDAGPVDPAFLLNFRRASVAASNDESRRVLMGVYLDVGKKGDYMIGCDGRRLCALNTIKLPFADSCIVPASKFMTWPKLDPQELLIGYAQPKEVGWFRLVTACWDYQTRTIEGTYPNWRQVVPTDGGKHRIALGDEDAALLLKVLPTFAGHDTHNGGITFVAEQGKVQILGQGKEDKNPTRLDLVNSKSEGGQISTTVAREYLLDALTTGFRVFAFQDDQSPLLAKDAQGGVHVLMPMRTGPVPAPKAATPAEVPAPEAAPPPAADDTTSHKEERSMSKTSESPASQPQGSALERVLAAYETAKTKVKEANEALATIAMAVKEALKEDKQRRAEVESVRAGLARLQSIKV